MKRWVVPVVCVITLALVANVVGAVVLLRRLAGPKRPEPPAASPSPGPSPTVPGGPPGGGSPIQPLVRQLQGFVERERGLRFKTPVAVALLDDAAFRLRAAEIDEEDRSELQKAQAVLQAMGLLRRGIDLVKEVQSFAAAAVVGLYDPETDELLVRGAQVTPAVRVTLVHELTHALEDQHFDLDRDELGDEADLGFTTLVEGSALRVEEAYLRSLPAAERARVLAEEVARAGGVPSGVPEVIELALGFPYQFGPDLVSAVLRAGGRGRLDAAFSDPPASAEQAIEPRRYLRGDKPRPVPVPPAPRPAIDDGEIGQLFLVLMLRAEIDRDDARRASDGWGGDRYVAWREGDRTCVRMDFVMDTAQDTRELVAALQQWAAERGASASASGTSLTTCG